MGLFGPSREERERRAHAADVISKFLSVAKRLRPEWSVHTGGESLHIHASCRSGEEAVDLTIVWDGGFDQRSGDLIPSDLARASLCVMSPSTTAYLLNNSVRRDYNPEAFDSLVDYIQNSALTTFRSRTQRLKSDLGL